MVDDRIGRISVMFKLFQEIFPMAIEGKVFQEKLSMAVEADDTSFQENTHVLCHIIQFDTWR
jgi:hypothetical protein